MATRTITPAVRSTSVVLHAPAGSSGVIVPANATRASVQFVLPVDAERASTGARMDYSIDVSTNNGVTWEPYLMVGWLGGTGFIGKNSTVVNPPPAATLEADFFQAFAGHKVRVSAKLTEPLTLGLTVTVI